MVRKNFHFGLHLDRYSIFFHWGYGAMCEKRFGENVTTYERLV